MKALSPKEFRNNQLEKLRAMEEVDFLRHLYNSDQKTEIEEIITSSDYFIIIFPLLLSQ